MSYLHAEATILIVTVGADALIRIFDALARATRSRGMVGGQALHLKVESRELYVAMLENIHVHKTGALGALTGAILLSGTVESPILIHAILAD